MKIKKLKIKLNKDNEYSDYRYFIPKSNNIKMTDGRDVDEAVQSLKDKIANLKEQASYLIDKAPLVKYAEGTSITITDCAEAPLRKFSIEGNSYQETREGYNLLPIETINTTINDVTVINNGDGSLTLNGTAKAYTAITLFSGKQINLSADTYLVSKKEISGTYTTSSQFLELQDSENQRVLMFGGVIGNVSLSQEKVVAKGYIAFAGGAVFNNYRFALSLVNSKNAEKPYEPYGAMPSFDFKSPVKTVGQNVNLFNWKTITLNKTIQNSGAVVNSNYNFASDFIEVKSNTKYTVNDAIPCIYEFDETKTIISVLRNSKTGGTVTTSANAKYLRVRNYYLDGDLTELAKTAKLVEGTKVGGYSPYGQGSVEIQQFNANLLDMANAKGGTSAGITCTVNNNGSYSYVGTATDMSVNVWFLGVYSSSATTPVLFTLKAGTYYIKDCRLYNKTSRIGGTKAGEIITLTKDTNITGVRAVNAVVGTNYNETLYPIIALSNAPVDFIQHQGQIKALYTQQPFKAIGDVKDRFIKKDEVWYEEHNINRKVYKGTETFRVTPNGNKLQIFVNDLNDIGKVGSFCNMLKSVNDIWNISEYQDVIKISDNLTAVNIMLQNTEINTINLLKEKLTTLYNIGIPLYVDYILKTPMLIPCTMEQIEILDNLQSYDKITYYNVDKINNVQANIKLIYKQDINAILKEKGV